ncbi:hypothetical protein BKA65DRAFT_140829 [Rhexocercosporidium sp. MPI-PUGE-AT-0058]|nr:hypothetical protein BKA65DRAFT_140829 [Rhexocercosporidium sp. MPI-PUGE-AT-0058]
MPPRRRATVSTKPKPLTAFSLFPKLPIELRIKIFADHLDTSSRLVHIYWNARQRVFKSSQAIPPLLHVCRESRYEALKTYELAFAPSREFARVYFCFERDVLMVCWRTLGAYPGRIGRKMGVEEAGRVRYLVVNEESMLFHAEDDGRELERFTGLRHLGVACDPENVESGEQYGRLAMERLAYGLSGGFDDEVEDEEGEGEGVVERKEKVGREERWPEVVCLRVGAGLERCSRHWWCDGWNQRAAELQREKWPKVLARSMLVTQFESEEGDALFLMHMLFFHPGQVI